MRRSLVLLALLFLPGCGLLGIGDPWDRIEAVAWELASLEGSAPLPGARVTLHFEDGGRLYGEGGIDPYFGTYSRPSRGQLRLGRIGSAKKGGPAELLHQQERFLTLLGGVDGYALESGELRLLLHGQEVLHFVEQP